MHDHRHEHAPADAPACAADGGGDTCGCSSTTVAFDGTDAVYIRRLWLVIAINAAMFVVEMGGGWLAGSQALQADALDFLGDTLTYGLSLLVIGKSLKARASVAMLKSLSLFAMGLWVLLSTLYQTFILHAPAAPLMGSIAFAALAANLLSVLLLLPYKDGDANVRSVWLCSRNDAWGNLGVIAAAGLVWLTGSAWPDLVVAFAMAALFTHSAWRILAQAKAEYAAA
ncbi:MAG TPA: cation transporter [Thermopetrobacter sp.]|nr:cation transporter [Thermopetrobacter sp.]